MEIPSGNRPQRSRIYDRNATLDITMENKGFIGYVLIATRTVLSIVFRLFLTVADYILNMLTESLILHTLLQCDLGHLPLRGGVYIP